jgi:hypothetical protein
MPVIYEHRSLPAPAPASAYQYSNPYNEAVAYLQGNTSGNGVENATTRAELSRYDAVVLQWKWPAAQSLETTYMSQLRSAHSHLKILMYCDPRFVTDGDSGGGGTTTVVGDIINSAGAPGRWKAENVANDWLSHRFNFNSSRAANLTDITSTNSAGDTFGVAFIKQLETYFQLSLYDGAMFDDTNCVGNNMSVYGVNADVNWDYLNNGTAPNFMSDATAKAAWSAGQSYIIDTVYRSRQPGKLVNRNTDPTYWYQQTDADGCPARPFSSHPYFASDDISMCEGLFEFSGGYSVFGRTDDVYPIQSYFSVANIFLAFEFYRQISRPATTNLMGRQVAFAHGNLSIGDTGSPSAKTYALCRSRWALGKLADAGYATSRSGSRSFPLDELCIALGGAPTTTTAMLATFDQTSAPVTYSLRSADASSGAGRLYWVEYPDAIVFCRTDIDGLTPGSSNFGDGSDITFTLPSAGSGKQWDRFNAATYVHPTLSRLSMQSQDTAFNSGATNVTTITLKPLHGGALRRVAV